jgi:membrane protease subunit HflC
MAVAIPHRNRLIQIGLLVLALLVVLSNTVYVVGQTQQALLLRFGEPIGVVNAGSANAPGLHLKTPFLDKVVMFDKRILAQEADQEEIITADQQRLVVDAFIRYRIVDPLQFYRTLRDEERAQLRLDTLVNSSLRQILGSASQTDIVSSRRGALMLAARNDIATRAQQGRFGIRVLDLRIKRADLPEANRDAVFIRMRTAREQEAAQLRAEGERRKREIVADARQQAGKIQGEGDAQRAIIFNNSFGRDPEFAAFYRSMQAYERGIGQGDSTLVLSPDSAFFRYFENGASGGR